MARKKTGAFNAEHPFGKPAETSTLKILVAITFVLVGLCLIIWMISTAPEEKRLKCSGPSSIIGFGSCVLDDNR